MRERFPGYHRPSEDEFAELWKKALIVPDTNILLTLYRLPEDTRAKLIEILGRLADRLFVPHQVGIEFQRNRLEVIDDQMKAYTSVEEAIEGFATSVGKEVREHPSLDREDLEQRINKGLAPVRAHLDELRKSHPDPLTDGDPLGADAVRDALEPLVEGRIGEPRDLGDVAKVGAKRYAQKVPPGFEDAKKPEPGCYGDLAIWLDVIDKADADKKPIILVTQDRKEDWWWIRHGKTIGPRPELIAEMQASAGQSLWMYTLGPFMEEAAKFLGIELTDTEREDVERAENAAQRMPFVIFDNYKMTEPGMKLVDFGTVGTATPLASGIDPSQTYYTYPSPGQSVMWNQWKLGRGWVARVDVGEESALLAIEWDPNVIRFDVRMTANRLLCRVTAPDGGVHSASRRGTDMSAAFRYPDNFDGVEAAEQGSYSYAWYFGEADAGGMGQEVAAGIFEIPSSAD